MTRERKLNLIYRHTHRDYKGHLDGFKSILVLRDGGSTLVRLIDFTDAEIDRLLPCALQREAKRTGREG